jgi:hypothetical protein
MRALSALLWVVCLASTARAADGVLEINQACATGPGCFPADSPGFPVEIIGIDSYRLTSNLTAPDANTTVISIFSPTVSLDLNGFAIQGPNDFFGPGTSCTAPGTGTGIFASSAVLGIVISNGHVRGMGSHGINLGVATHIRISEIVAEKNCGDGINVGPVSLVFDSVARMNAGRGISGSSTIQVRNSVAVFNLGSGFAQAGNLGRWLVHGNVANLNGVHGIELPAATGHLVLDSLATNNAQHGITVGSNALVLRSSAIGNIQSGIAATNNSNGIGFITTNGNGADVSGGPTLVGCIVAGGGQFCP